MNDHTIKRIIRGQSVSDGAGVKLNRLIASAHVDHIDPFFLLDEFRSDDPNDYIAGFPMHPHRGIETITYMIEGSFTHRDSRGGGGILNAGEVQWMTAGKGILHEEMPAMESGHLWGYQLWLNLPKKLKWVEPAYQHLGKEDIPIFEKDGLRVVIISGNYEGLKGPASNYVPADYYDIYLDNGKSFELQLKKNFSSLIYVHSGRIEIDGQIVEAKNMAELNEDRPLKVKAVNGNAGFLFLSAIPNNEPYYRGGPFVMNTREEIMQAFEDYQKGNLF
jgi:redox-sensitive bicupin YhaK (pirin superfamily)